MQNICEQLKNRGKKKEKHNIINASGERIKKQKEKENGKENLCKKPIIQK